MTMCDDLDMLSHNFLYALLLLALCTKPFFSTSTKVKVKLSLDHAWAQSMLNKYCNIINEFHSFCDKEHILVHHCLLVDGYLLCAFATSHVDTLADKTVHGHMAAIKAWHVYNDPHWLGGARLHCVLTSIANLATQSSKPSHPPVTQTILSILTATCAPLDPFNSCCLAVACFTLWGQVHLGEILSPWEKSFKPLLIPCLHHLFLSFNKNRSCKCHLPFTKWPNPKERTWLSADRMTLLIPLQPSSPIL